MRDIVRRLLIAGLIALCVGMLFLGGKHPRAEEIGGQTEHWIWPADGEITDTYGTRGGLHKGLDIAADLKTPVYAVDEGVVSKSYYSDTYGHVIFIKHKNNFETVYAHLHKRNVKEGENISQGALIGEMGNTGDSSGVHLHFEVHHEEWTYSKENALNPDNALGLTEVGQVVMAQSKAYPGETIETAGHPHPEEELQNSRLVLDSSSESPESGHSEEQSLTHLVQPGETLWSIAQKYQSNASRIAELNHIQGDKIQVGQNLTIKEVETKHYIVGRGDTLSSIARKTGVSVKELKSNNQLDSNVIYPQQVLIITQ
ncbi:LysM domain-containing protein [Mesobacillus persicus]|uniref:LysM domain-containing protein n=1 Tax=Mesobacillus persicus TaxID=930146 RepID=A0A1H8BTJ1_9BACI|nr:peptidoglycan DD-metalloendopeptidase family protein [Mesobacillus persicus]SEM86211.1 LysM domain-containing protein [Mesobacillus persicus]